jgi:hypothetical protein
MKEKIVSFGDSFIFGSELKDNFNGSKAWPGLAAKQLGVSYETHAVPGCGNDHIARQIYSYFSTNSVEKTLAVINWTWTQRWDFYIVGAEQWITLGPTCVPEKLNGLLDKTKAHNLVDFYNSYTGKSLLWNKFRNLQTIHSVQSFLKSLNVTNVQTFMDDHLFDTTFHAPDYVKVLQNCIKPDMYYFEGQSFLEWAKKYNFKITSTLHPLEDAQSAAADLWVDVYRKK